MVNENRSSQPWKKLLDDEVALSGEGVPDKGAVWQKLHQRLHQQSPKERVVWYWVAAACLLLVIALPYIFVQQPQATIVKVNSPKHTAIDKESKGAVLPTVSRVVKTTPQPASKMKTAKLKTISDTVAVFITNKTKPEEVHDSANNNLTLSTISVDSAVIAPAELVQTKRKLKVVHINELGEPVEQTLAISRSNEPHSFELKLADEQVFINNAAPSNKARSGMIIIKTAPAN